MRTAKTEYFKCIPFGGDGDWGVAAKGKEVYIGTVHRVFSHFSTVFWIFVFLASLLYIFLIYQGGQPCYIRLADASQANNFNEVASCYTPYAISFGQWAAIILVFLFGAFLLVSLAFRKQIIFASENVMARQRGSGTLIRLIAGCPKVRKHAAEYSKRPDLDYIIFRRACHTKQVFWLPLLTRLRLPTLRPNLRKRESGLLHSLNDITISRAALAIQSEIMPQLGEGRWFGDAITDWEGQKTAYHDGEDLPLRFHQATPNARFTDSQKDTEQTPKAKYIFFVCLTNPIRDVIQITTLEDVLKKLEHRFPETYSEIIQELEEPVFPLFYKVRADRAEEDAFLAQHSERRPILQADKKSRCGYRSGFDVNKLDRDRFDELTPDQRKAIQSFYHAINDTVSDATDINLRHGDVLLINNYYTFHRRKELRYRIVNWITLLPKRRWLRVYFTFPAYYAHERQVKEAQSNNNRLADQELAPGILASHRDVE